MNLKPNIGNGRHKVTMDWRITFGNIASMLVFVAGIGAVWQQIHMHLEAPAHHGAEQRLDKLEEDYARLEVLNDVRYKALTERVAAQYAELLRRFDDQSNQLTKIENRLNVHDERD